MRLTGRTVLLTGGGTGIGRALARQLADKGNSVLICGRRLEPLQETATVSKGIYPHRGDLTSSYDIQQMLSAIELTQRMLDGLRQAFDPTIIIVGSPAGLGPLANTPIYSSSKAGLHAYTLCLRHHLENEIRVIEVFPPTVDTPMLADKNWKKMSSAECARRMLRDIERGHEQVWIGESRMFRFLSLVLPPARLFRVVNEWSPPDRSGVGTRPPRRNDVNDRGPQRVKRARGKRWPLQTKRETSNKPRAR